MTSLTAEIVETGAINTDVSGSLRSTASIEVDSASNWFIPQFDLEGGKTLAIRYVIEFSANGDVGPHTNVAKVTAEDGFGDRNLAGQDDEEVIVTLNAEGVDIDKEVVGTEVAVDSSGDAIQNTFETTFTLQVSNSNEDLVNVDLTDNLSTGWAAAGGTAQIISIVELAGDPTNSTVWTVATTPVAPSATSLVASTPLFVAQEDAIFEIVVRYEVSNSLASAMPITNIGQVTGTDPAGNDQTSTDSVRVNAEDLIGDTGALQLVVEKDGGIAWRPACKIDPLTGDIGV
jgi:hypothetical protein